MQDIQSFINKHAPPMQVALGTQNSSESVDLLSPTGYTCLQMASVQATTRLQNTVD